ncbi:MAG TPA: hypothetical protein VIC32_08100, partial [Terriglobales bacterium]
MSAANQLLRWAAPVLALGMLAQSQSLLDGLTTVELSAKTPAAAAMAAGASTANAVLREFVAAYTQG